MLTPGKYLPFMTGAYSSAPGLSVTGKAEHPEDRMVFQITDTYTKYISNKKACRIEGIEKYYLEAKLMSETIDMVNNFVMKSILQDYPEIFSLENGYMHNRLNGEQVGIISHENYKSLFDALCSQVQEDLAVIQLTESSEYLSAIHLCAPNHWNPSEKIGKPFDVIHQPVPEMAKTLRNYSTMLAAIVKQKGPFTRFAWGVGTDDRLNHHPIPPPGISKYDWEGRSSNADKLFVRVERQCLLGIPEVKAFLFTIRTYLYDVDDLSYYEREMLWKSVSGMSEETIRYKGLKEIMPLIKERVQK